MKSVLQTFRLQMAEAIVGQQDLVDELLITLICRAHSQIEGPAGVGKWLAVESLAKCLGLTARKLRCSPDLRPQDLVELGGPVEKAATGASPRGRILGNVVLADNMARLAPRVHNLLQQAMQERVMDIRGQRWELPDPFSLFATRYPADDLQESESASDDDRFLFRIAAPFPRYHEEFEMAHASTESPPKELHQVLSREDLAALQSRVTSGAPPPPVLHYAVRLVRATRVHEGENPDFIYEWVRRGAGPRAVHSLVFAAKARAVLDGRFEATRDDLRAVVLPALRHRIVSNRNACANGITPDRVIHRLLDEIPPRVRGDDVPPLPGKSFTFHDWTPIGD